PSQPKTHFSSFQATKCGVEMRSMPKQHYDATTVPHENNSIVEIVCRGTTARSLRRQRTFVLLSIDPHAPEAPRPNMTLLEHQSTRRRRSRNSLQLLPHRRKAETVVGGEKAAVQ